MPSRTHARWLAAALLPALVGCVGSRGDTDLLEARLRDQQDLTARYEKLLDANQEELTLARKETDLLRTQIAAANAQPLLPEHADVLLRAEKLAFHEMMTGTRDADGTPGDDALNVVLMPQSQDGETIRLVGELEVEALDLGRPEGRQQIGHWKYTSQEARELWHSGFLASGFQIDVPWEARTTSPEVVLHARLKTADGRQFDASHKVRVGLPLIQTASAELDSPRIEPRRFASDASAQELVSDVPPEPLAFPDRSRQSDADAAPIATAPAEPTAESVTDASPFPVAPQTSPHDAVEDAAAADHQPFPMGGSVAEAATPAVENEAPAGLASPATPFDIVPNVGSSAAAETACGSDLPYIEPQPARPVAAAAPAGAPAIDHFASRPADAGRARIVVSSEQPVPPPSDPGVIVRPLAQPQRYRRETPPTSTGPAVAPAPSSPAIDAQVTPTPADSVDPPPFPIDMTAPAAVPALPTSVNWTDESIPYLR